MPEPIPTLMGVPATVRAACAACGSLQPNPECETCVAEQLAREVASLPDLSELQED